MSTLVRGHHHSAIGASSIPQHKGTTSRSQKGLTLLWPMDRQRVSWITPIPNRELDVRIFSEPSLGLKNGFEMPAVPVSVPWDNAACSYHTCKLYTLSLGCGLADARYYLNIQNVVPPRNFWKSIFFFYVGLQIPSTPQHQRIWITTNASKVLTIFCTFILIRFEHCCHDRVYLLLSRDVDRTHLVRLDGGLMGAWWGLGEGLVEAWWRLGGSLRSAQNVSRRSFEKCNYTHNFWLKFDQEIKTSYVFSYIVFVLKIIFVWDNSVGVEELIIFAIRRRKKKWFPKVARGEPHSEYWGSGGLHGYTRDYTAYKRYSLEYIPEVFLKKKGDVSDAKKRQHWADDGRLLYTVK